MSTPFGQALRRWRKARGGSQLDLSLHARTSPRHVSFLETGRSRPGEEMVQRLGESLDLPLRDRNDLLRSAGFAPVYPEHTLTDAAMAPYLRIVDRMLAQHSPFPAFVVDRWWGVVQTNDSARLLMGGLTESRLDFVDLLDGPLRDMLDNWADVAWHSVYRLRRETAAAGSDARLESLLRRLEALVDHCRPPTIDPASPLVSPIVRFGDQRLRFVGTIARFGSAVDVTLSELRVELLYPADDATEAVIRAMVPPA